MHAGWDSKAYEYAASKGLPFEGCSVYAATSAGQCTSLQECFMCSGAGNHTCRPVVRPKQHYCEFFAVESSELSRAFHHKDACITAFFDCMCNMGATSPEKVSTCTLPSNFPCC